MSAGRPARWLEERLQDGLRLVGAVSEQVRARAAGPPEVADLRGRSCHCRPGAPRHLVHSEGLREGCDFVVDQHSNVSHPARPQRPVPLLARAAAELPAGSSVHVKADRLPGFVLHLLPLLRGPIVLVTGDSDFAPVQRFEWLLSDTRVLHWFAQNCDVPWRHPRLTRVPIGIDNPVFTKLEKRLGFLLTMALGRTPLDLSLSRNDIGDQLLLQRVRAGFRRGNAERAARVLCTFQHNSKLASDISGVPERVEASAALSSCPQAWFAPRRLPQEQCWRLHEAFAFEACPRGNGLDTFRLWEALFLGTIPIVRASTLDPLFEDERLPVVVVESWREVDEGHLARWHRELRDAFTPHLDTKLGNDYWLAKIRAAQARAAREGADEQTAAPATGRG